MDFYAAQQTAGITESSPQHHQSTAAETTLGGPRPAYRDAFPRHLQSEHHRLVDYSIVRSNPVSVGNPSDISAWPHIVDMGNTMHPIDEFHDGASPQCSSIEQPGMVGVPLGLHISCPQLQRQRINSPLTSYSPGLSARYNPNTSYPSSLASASPTPTQTALANIQMSQSALQEVHPPRSTSSFGGKTAAAESEPADAPWNLVPYNLPFTGGAGNNRDQTGGGSSGSPAGPNSSGMFLRSPTPTRRQRTNQACEKCRDRKAKCNGARPTCLRCQNRGLPCEYAKERRMRGPNKGQAAAGRQSASVSPSSVSFQQLSSNSSSSTATPTQDNPVSTHPPNGGNETGPGDFSSNSQQLQTSSQQHRRIATFNDTPHHNNGMVHANLSQPDLHFLANSYPRSASLSNSRPRAHTASHTLSMQHYPLPHLPQKAGAIYPFHHQPSPSTSTELSSGSLSEPPSATESNFGLDAHVAHQMNVSNRYSPSFYGRPEFVNVPTDPSILSMRVAASGLVDGYQDVQNDEAGRLDNAFATHGKASGGQETSALGLSWPNGMPDYDQVTASTALTIGAGINHLQGTLHDQTFAGGLHTLGHSMFAPAMPFFEQPHTELSADDAGPSSPGWGSGDELAIQTGDTPDRRGRYLPSSASGSQAIKSGGISDSLRSNISHPQAPHSGPLDSRQNKTQAYVWALGEDSSAVMTPLATLSNEAPIVQDVALNPVDEWIKDEAMF